MKWPDIPKKYLYTTAACPAVGAVLFFPGSAVMLAIGAALGYRGHAWLHRSDQNQSKEMIDL